jgi:hypothetical protein
MKFLFIVRMPSRTNGSGPFRHPSDEFSRGEMTEQCCGGGVDVMPQAPLAPL